MEISISRRTHGWLVAVCCLSTISCAVKPGADNSSEFSSPATTSPKPPLDLTFARPGGVELQLDLHLPKKAQQPPLVVYIHGGGWSSGSRKADKMQWLTAHGYAVASIEYRMGREARFPAQIHDCKGALRWLRAHQQTYGYDASRVVVAGSSAGGHLAALMGTTGGLENLEGRTAGHLEQSSGVQGVINYYGPSDFIARSKIQPDKTESPRGPVYQLLGGPVSRMGSLARTASPAHHVGPGDAPLLILHGDQDEVVPLSQSELLLETYQTKGLEAQLHVEPGKGHGWHPISRKEKKLVLAFLEKQLRESRFTAGTMLGAGM